MKTLNVYVITYGPNVDYELRVISRIYDKLLKSDFDFALYICDNNSCQEFKDKLKEKYSDERVFLWEEKENIGKARIVNKVHSIAKDSDYICSIDGDLLISSHNFFNTLLFPLIYRSNTDKIKACVSNLIGSNTHNYRTDCILTLKGKEYYLNKKNEGISGGCLAVETKVWNEIGGYKETLIYGGNDGRFMKDLSERDYLACVSRDAICYHDFSEDDYQLWKVETQKKLNDPNILFKPNTGFYDNII